MTIEKMLFDAINYIYSTPHIEPNEGLSRIFYYTHKTNIDDQEIELNIPEAYLTKSLINLRITIKTK